MKIVASTAETSLGRGSNTEEPLQAAAGDNSPIVVEDVVEEQPLAKGSAVAKQITSTQQHQPNEPEQENVECEISHPPPTPTPPQATQDGVLVSLTMAQLEQIIADRFKLHMRTSMS